MPANLELADVSENVQLFFGFFFFSCGASVVLSQARGDDAK